MSGAARGWLVVLAVSGVATTMAAAAPRGLRRMDSFHVQQVTVTGTRYLSAEEVLAASGIVPTSTVFDDFELWRNTLRRHPMILDVTVERQLPATIVLHVSETQPLAFARLGRLRAVDARGRILTADPALLPLDLPVLSGVSRAQGDDRITDLPSLRALTALAALARHQPELFALASEAATLDDGVRIILREPLNAELLVPFAPDAERLHHLRLALADVSMPRDSAPAALARLRRIDARFREQIVVSLQTGGQT